MAPPDRDSGFLPPGYPAAVPSLRVRSAEDLLDFLTAAFDGEVVDRSEDEDGRLVYAAVRLGPGIVEVSEATDRFPAIRGAVHLYVPDTDRTHAAALAAGATELYPPSDMPYDERSSGLEDGFGNQWYLGTYRGGGSEGSE